MCVGRVTLSALLVGRVMGRLGKGSGSWREDGSGSLTLSLVTICFLLPVFDAYKNTYTGDCSHICRNKPFNQRGTLPERILD